jgi:hypothetical protein
MIENRTKNSMPEMPLTCIRLHDLCTEAKPVLYSTPQLLCMPNFKIAPIIHYSLVNSYQNMSDSRDDTMLHFPELRSAV